MQLGSALLATVPASLALLRPGLAAPSPNTGPPEPISPYQCSDHIDSSVTNILFYSGYEKQVRKTLSNVVDLQGYKILPDLYRPSDFPNKYYGKFFKGPAYDDAFTLFWNSCSEIAALQAEGRVYVVLSPNSGSGLYWGVEEDTFWARIQFPILCANDQVTELIRMTSSAGKPNTEDVTQDMLRMRRAGLCPKIVRKLSGPDVARESSI